MNAIARLFSSPPEPRAAVIRTELEKLTAPNEWSRAMAEVGVLRQKMTGLAGDELKAAEIQIEAKVNAAAQFKAKHEKDFERVDVLAAELGTLSRAEKQARAWAMHASFVSGADAAAYAAACDAFIDGLVSRAALARAIDLFSDQCGAGVPMLAAGFPDFFSFPDSSNSPSGIVTSRRRELFAAIAAAVTKVLAELQRE